MRAGMRYAGLLILLLLAACSKPPAISAADRVEIMRIADDIGSAAQSRNAAAVIRHLTSDARLSLAGTQYDVDTYAEFLEKIFPLISDYSYTRSKESMQPAANGADVIFTFSLNEQYTFGGKRHSENHTETYFLRKEAGRFKIYKVIGQ